MAKWLKASSNIASLEVSRKRDNVPRVKTSLWFDAVFSYKNICFSCERRCRKGEQNDEKWVII